MNLAEELSEKFDIEEMFEKGRGAANFLDKLQSVNSLLDCALRELLASVEKVKLYIIQ